MDTLYDFPDLTPAETGLFRHLRNGEPGTFFASNVRPPDDAPSDVHIRASLIRALILRRITDVPLPESGLRIHGAFIPGDGSSHAETPGLDLEGASLTGDLALIACRIPDMVLIRRAEIKSLFLNFSWLGAGLKADGLSARGDLVLDSLTSVGQIRLAGAQLGADLDCTGATLTSTDAALHADGLSTKGSVVLRRLTSAGVIRLPGAQLGGDLSCTGAELTATDKALHADGLSVKGGIFLCGLTSAGEVRLPGTQLGSNLDCSGAKLKGTGRALNCEGAKIGGVWFWRNGAYSPGAINLTAAEIGAICDDPDCWPPEILLDRCRYGAFIGKGVDGPQRIDWLSRQNPQKYGQDFWPQPYAECARALRDAGHEADARLVMIEKDRLQREARHRRMGTEIAQAKGAYRNLDLWLQRWLLRAGDGMIGILFAYGRHPLQAVIPLIVALLIGAMIFSLAAGFGEIKPNLPQIQRAPEWVACGQAEGAAIAGLPSEAASGRARAGETQLACFLRQPEALAYPRFSPLIYSADTLLPIVNLEMQSYWIPDDSKPIGAVARFYLWAHIFAGWGLTLLAVAGFSGLIKTDNTR